MSTIVTTEAIVLKSMNYRETSKIVTFYTRQYGKLSGIVKGARRMKSKYGSALEPMTYVSIVLYKKEGRTLHIVSQCDRLKSFPHLADDLDKMAAGLSMVELLALVTHEEEENLPLFRLIVGSLSILNDATKNHVHLFYFFELHLAKALGFQPLFDRCVICGKADFLEAGEGQRIEYHLDKGGPLCRHCGTIVGHKVKLSAEVFSILRQISESETSEDIHGIESDAAERREIESFLWSYLNYHISGLRPLRSGKVFSKILSS